MVKAKVESEGISAVFLVRHLVGNVNVFSILINFSAFTDYIKILLSLHYGQQLPADPVAGGWLRLIKEKELKHERSQLQR